MKIYFNRTFKGHYPVGTSAVIVAESRVAGRKLLEAELERHGLLQKIPAADMQEIDVTEAQVVILCDGNY